MEIIFPSSFDTFGLNDCDRMAAERAIGGDATVAHWAEREQSCVGTDVDVGAEFGKWLQGHKPGRKFAECWDGGTEKEFLVRHVQGESGGLTVGEIC